MKRFRNDENIRTARATATMTNSETSARTVTRTYNGRLFFFFASFTLMKTVLQTHHPFFVKGQFNEPPGQRREQTFRVLEFESGTVNQHYPGDLRYYCTFRGKWTEERHPRDFPRSPSWSAPVMVSHSKNYRMWTGTETVTAGVEYLAEEGYPTVLNHEFVNAGAETLMMTVGERMFDTDSSQELPPINVTYAHPWLSAMTKIIPSPDWFAGFSDLRTVSYDTETFYNRIVILSYVWDSGTDGGQTYLAFDRDLDPQVPCMRFCVPAGWGGKDTNIVQNPLGNNKKCPDEAKGRVEIPRLGQFLDYTGTYIPYPAEYECVLRVGEGDIYAGNAFNESQIRPPLRVPRPDDDFLDGINPYDQPAYDNKYEEFYGKPKEPEKKDWNKNWLWLLLPLLFCIIPMIVICFMLMCKKRRKKEDEEKSLNEDFDEGFVGDEYDGQNLFYNTAESGVYDHGEYDYNAYVDNLQQDGSNPRSGGDQFFDEVDEDGNLIEKQENESASSISYDQNEENSYASYLSREQDDEDYESYLTSHRIT